MLNEWVDQLIKTKFLYRVKHKLVSNKSNENRTKKKYISHFPDFHLGINPLKICIEQHWPAITLNPSFSEKKMR